MKVELPTSVKGRLRRALWQAGRSEIGGVLMGEQVEPGHFRIVDLSIDDTTGGAAHFVRSTEVHLEALDAFFARTGNNYVRFNYLGEWHSHPSYPVTPSAIDQESMLELVNGERDIDFAMLLIVRLHWWHAIKCACSLFQRGQGASPVEILETRAR
jgi:integrative and conjugative element protein (TIGR02256 family)